MAKADGQKPLTLKALNEKIDRGFGQTSRLLRRAVLAAVLVGAGMVAGFGLWIKVQSHESQRTCDAIDKVVDYLFDQAPSTRSLPARTADQQAAYEKYRADLRSGISGTCGG